MSKHLVVCCDGTWNFAGQSNRTNVAKVTEAVLRRTSSGTEQRVWYRSGVGTRRSERLRGGAFGLGLSRNVIDAYRFLIDNYEPGDRLYLFGFSRGAFTARSLAGLVRNCGILRPENADRTKQAWALYRSRAERPAGEASVRFRQAYARETKIHFIGVWDTVGALGIPVPGPRPLKPLVGLVNQRWAFHDTELSGWVEAAFQALAIDEQRAVFEPTLWHQQPDAASSGQELQQMWFAGVHCDIGGGYKETSLSDISLLWMVDHARDHGLEFDAHALGTAGRSATALGEMHDSRKGAFGLGEVLHRPIGQAADDHGRLSGAECLAATAKERYDRDKNYRPPELVKYLTAPRKPCIKAPLPAVNA
jgi:uncharacterized protein (DUF2235 family)